MDIFQENLFEYLFVDNEFMIIFGTEVSSGMYKNILLNENFSFLISRVKEFLYL